MITGVENGHVTPKGFKMTNSRNVARRKGFRHASLSSVIGSSFGVTLGQQHTEQPKIINDGRVDQRIPTGKLLNSCMGKVDIEPPHGLNVDISKINKCKQTLDLSVGTSTNVQQKQRIDFSTVVSKSSTVTTADVSDKHQQQPDSTSSTSTLATTVHADGNFDFDDGNPSKVNIKQLCGRTYALSWKPCQGDSLNLPDHRYKHQCCNPIPAKSYSLPHAHT
nr:hypothetical protein [Tanacetum cinerariifolium]